MKSQKNGSRRSVIQGSTVAADTVKYDPRLSMQQNYIRGVVECLICEAVGIVKKSTESGNSDRIVIWRRKGPGKPYAESWRWDSVPSSCDKCWQEEREERARNAPRPIPEAPRGTGSTSNRSRQADR